MPYRNRLLRMFTPHQRRLLKPPPEQIVIPAQGYLFRCGEPIRALFFPESGVISASLPEQNGEEVKLWTASGPHNLCLGAHTLFRLPEALYDFRAHTEARGWSIRREALCAAMAQDSALHNLFQRVLHVIATANRQQLVCRTKHSHEQRLCCTLMMLQESLGDRIALPRELIASFVPCPPKYFYELARSLTRAGIIRLEGGDIVIHDSAALEQRSCGCFTTLIQQHDDLFASVT